MKFLILITLLISLAATVVPCCEFDGCQDELNNGSHHDKKEQKGTCSPFSTCATCSGAVVITKAVQMGRPLVYGIEFAEKYFPSLFHSYYPSFWQPPRLG
jgi:hypothetical protein